MRLVTNKHTDLVYRTAVPATIDEDSTSERTFASSVVGAPPKGIIRYGHPVNLVNCDQLSLCLYAMDEEDGLKSVGAKQFRAGHRSRDTKEAAGFLSWELRCLSRSRRIRNPEDDPPGNLLKRSKRSWLGSQHWGTEFVILPSPETPENELGDPVRFRVGVVICQADSFGGPRYVLDREDGKPVLRSLEELLHDRHGVPEWMFVNADEPRGRDLVTQRHTVTWHPYGRSGQLAVEDGQVNLLTDVREPHQRIPGYYWRVQLVTAQPPSAVEWDHHFLDDPLLPAPIEALKPQIFASTVEYSAEALQHIKTEDGSIDLNVQELLLVVDCIHCIFGVAGEFINLNAHFPPLSVYPDDPHVAKDTPVFSHSFRTFCQQHQEVQSTNFRPLHRSRPNTHDMSSHFESLHALDQSLQDMTDKIMEAVHQISLVRHVAEYHLMPPTTRTNEALGAAIKYILKELEARAAELEAWSQTSTLSLQRLWSILHEAKPALDLLAKICKATYGVEGLPLLDILYRVRSEESANDMLKSMATFIIVAAAQPLEEILNKWVYQGILDDPRGEFFIVANPRLKSKPTTLMTRFVFWDQKFQVAKGRVPEVLRHSTKYIADSGRAWHTLREYFGASSPEFAKIVTKFTPESCLKLDAPNLPSAIRGIHNFIQRELFEVLRDDGELITRMTSMQSFFFHGKSDILADFFDIAADELDMSNPHFDTLETMFQRALNYSILSHDKHRDQVRLGCSQIPLPVMSRWSDSAWTKGPSLHSNPAGSAHTDDDDRSFNAPKHLDNGTQYMPNLAAFVKSSGIGIDTSIDSALVEYLDLFTSADEEESHPAFDWQGSFGLSETIIDALADVSNSMGEIESSHFLTYIPVMPWPLQIVFDSQSVVAYQNIFRTLFLIKYVQRKLIIIWKDLCAMDKFEANMPPECRSRVLSECLLLRQQMSQFITNLVTYMTEECLGPLSHEFNVNLSKVSTLCALQDLHKKFLHNCLYELLFTRSDLYRKLVKLLEICQLFVKFGDGLSLLSTTTLDHGDENVHRGNQLAKSIRLLNSDKSRQSVQELSDTFKDYLRAFLGAVIELSRSAYGNHTHKLLLRLDFQGVYRSTLSLPPLFVDHHDTQRRSSIDSGLLSAPPQ